MLKEANKQLEGYAFLIQFTHFPLYKSYEAWTLDPRFFEFRIRDFMLNKILKNR